jgi:serine/threonine-protein kinase
VLHQIGSGVLGPVFRTYDPQRDRLIAVKAFRLDLVPEDVARLADALRRLAAASPQHPSLVPAVDAGLEGATAFLAMDYVAGETLDVAFRHLAPAPLDRALPVLTQIADALEAGWAVGLGHGALHPRDVFLIAGTNDVRVTGTGVVPALEATGVKAPVRRPYTAPERAAGEAWDIRADVYSLGAIAHELLTRRRPAAPGEQDGALATGLSPEQRVHVRRILSAALAERPEHRFATPKALSDALAAVARGDAPSLPPEPQTVSSSSEKTPHARKKPVTTPLLETIEPPAAEVLLPAIIEPIAPVATGTMEAGTPPAPTLIVPVEPKQDDDTLSHFRSEGRTPAPSSPPPAEVAPPRLAREVPPASPTPPEPPVAAVVTPAPIERPLLFSEPPAAITSIRPEPFTTRARSVPPPFLTPAPSTPSFPWAAMIAATVAALAVGGVGGWAIGRSQAPSPATTTPAADTDVRVPAPVVTATPEATPPRATATPEAAPTRATPSPEVAKPQPAKPELPKPSTSPKPTPDARAATTSRGTATIKSSPSGALVTIDGHPHGTTPATIHDLSLGSHTLQVARPGYVPSSQPLVLTSAQPAQDITVELKPSADLRTPDTGSIFVDTRPRGARVTIDGRNAGTTPVHTASVTAGEHSLRIELAGYKDVATTVTVKGGAETPIQVTLEPVDGRRAPVKDVKKH